MCGKLYLGDRKMSRHLKVSSSFFFLAVSVSLLSSSFCSWLVGVCLNRHHILSSYQKHFFSIFRRTALQLRSLQQLQQQVGDRRPSRLRYRWQDFTDVIIWQKSSFSWFALKDLEASALLDLVGPRLFQSFSMWELLVRWTLPLFLNSALNNRF